MLGIFAFSLVMIGAINWFCIGLLQFDFVAGLFGSQASIFSRIIYVAIGASAFIVGFILIKNKGKVIFNLTKFKSRFLKKKQINTNENLTPQTNLSESGKDMANEKNSSTTITSENLKEELNQNENSINKPTDTPSQNENKNEINSVENKSKKEYKEIY